VISPYDLIPRLKVESVTIEIQDAGTHLAEVYRLSVYDGMIAGGGRVRSPSGPSALAALNLRPHVEPLASELRPYRSDRVGGLALCKSIGSTTSCWRPFFSLVRTLLAAKRAVPGHRRQVQGAR
jgi:hypothetical protein